MVKNSPRLHTDGRMDTPQFPQTPDWLTLSSPPPPLLCSWKPKTTTTSTNLRQIPTDRDQRKRKTSILFPYEEARRRKHELSATFVEEKGSTEAAMAQPTQSASCATCNPFPARPVQQQPWMKKGWKRRVSTGMNNIIHSKVWTVQPKPWMKNMKKKNGRMYYSSVYSSNAR